ncbi:hypothetical protein BH11VER1_BH11VER1_22930 [soil metagenome]
MLQVESLKEGGRFKKTKETATQEIPYSSGGTTGALLHHGFLGLSDSAIANDPSREPSKVLSDVTLAGVMVNKLLTAWPEDYLVKVYEEWCHIENKTSYTELPKFIKACQTSSGKDFTDTVTNKLLSK